MTYTLQVNEIDISYRIRRYPRAKHMRVYVGRGGMVTVTGPKHISVRRFHAFVVESVVHILPEVTAQLVRLPSDLSRTDRAHFLEHKAAAHTLAVQKVAQWNEVYGFSYGRITVKQVARQWGSCSSKGNLNFSYRILFLPEELQDYLVVHELCHLAEMNHSAAFWQLVARAIPEYRGCRQLLRNY